MKNLRSKKRGSVSNRLLIVLGLGVMGIFLAVCLKLIFLTHKPSVLPLRQEINLEGPTAKKEEAPLSFVEKEAERKEFVLQKNFLSPSPKVVTRITSQEPEFVQRLEEEGIKVEKLTKVAELKPEIFSQGRQKLTASETRDYFKFPYISGELIVMTNEGGYLLEVEKGEEEKTADLLSEEKEVIYAVPNTLYPLRLTAFPENPDPGLDYEWHLIKIEATQAWGISQGEGVKVAVLDTGIDLNHPDLKDNLDLETSYDYVDNDPLPEDILGHGTMIAGTIAGVGDNGLGIYGVAPKAKLVVLKIIDASGTKTDALKLCRALMQALDKGAGVINISFGSETDLMAANPVVEDVFNTLFALGIPVVSSAGNHKDDYLYPAVYEPVIAVGGTSKEDSRWISEIIDPLTGEPYTSAVGEHIDLSAPAEKIFTTALRNAGQSEAYLFAQGTSISTAIVSGVSALLLSTDPHLSLEKIKEILEDNTDPILSQELLGWGRVNAFRAVKALQELGDNLPPVANLSAEPLEGDAPLVVQFSAEGSYDPDGKITDYVWSFGDGEFVNRNPSPKHTYQYGGKYTVVLMVKDDKGAVERKRIEVKVKGEGQGEGDTVFEILLSGTSLPIYCSENGEVCNHNPRTGQCAFNCPTGQQSPQGGTQTSSQLRTIGEENPQDSDGDGLSDAYESFYGFDPRNRDSNGNGIDDKTEMDLIGWKGDGTGAQNTVELNWENGTWTHTYKDKNGNVLGKYWWHPDGKGGGEFKSYPPGTYNGGAGCFVAGTQIMTIEGLKNIEFIKEGDIVLSRNKTKNINEYKRVLNTMSIVRKGIIELTTNRDIKIVCSRNHRFFVKNKGWIRADRIKINEELLTFAGETILLKAKKLLPKDKEIKVYNFTVEDNHNYFVSPLGILVHNAKTPD